MPGRDLLPDSRSRKIFFPLGSNGPELSISQRLILYGLPCFVRQPCACVLRRKTTVSRAISLQRLTEKLPMITPAYRCSNSSKPSSWGLLTLPAPPVLKTVLTVLTWPCFCTHKRCHVQALQQFHRSKKPRSPGAEHHVAHPAYQPHAKVDVPSTRTISSPAESAQAPACADWLRQLAARAPDRQADTARSAAAA